ncbi:Protein-tyrosine-phosphatase [Plantibacter flavus]|uniref:Protein-tyrosine-phosphatase n=1 Tax=Plantibacter flavus TaxID=150123 RepID=A0A3N2C6V6_9MICO|nr:low molecular weight phosphatase family protein [Plantibacter flavus]ROR83239.1 protein-tyrosine-phosphatase [Plantibacter flavus]SMG21738.1 Protein-tyrosine-phosphatase [Plantibacter flavus]
MTTTKPVILFICQHNAGRSQLGAALLEHFAGDRFTATSAGLAPSDAVNPAVAATVAELGLDITDRVPRAVTAADLDQADVVVLMKPGLTLPATPRGEVLAWSFPNPEAWDVQAVRPLREAVAEQIRTELLTR